MTLSHWAFQMGFKEIAIADIKVGKRFREAKQVDAMIASYHKVGLIHPPTVDNSNRLVGGLRRLEALKQLGFKTITVYVMDTDSPLLAQFEENENRVPWLPTEAYRASIELRKEESLLARQRQSLKKSAPPDQKGTVRDKVAAKLGYSPKTLERIIKVCEIAEQYPDEPEAQAAKELLDKPKMIYKAHSRAMRFDRLMQIKPVRLPRDQFTFHAKDFRQVDWGANSLDMIYTDPPWKEIALYEDLAQIAKHSLKDNAFCMVYIGTHFLPKVLEAMGKHLNYVWQFVINYSGDYSTKMACGIMRRYTSVLVFTKGNRTAQSQWEHRVRGYDSYTVDSQRADRRDSYHQWQQALTPANYWLEACCTKGDTIADFCMGSGTFGVACNWLGMNYIGCDPDPNCVKIARHRIATETKDGFRPRLPGIYKVPANGSIPAGEIGVLGDNCIVS